MCHCTHFNVCFSGLNGWQWPAFGIESKMQSHIEERLCTLACTSHRPLALGQWYMTGTPETFSEVYFWCWTCAIVVNDVKCRFSVDALYCETVDGCGD